MKTMTREYAAVQLLKHGALNSREFKNITGWSSENLCNKVLERLRNKNIVRLARRGSRETFSVYELVA